MLIRRGLSLSGYRVLRGTYVRIDTSSTLLLLSMIQILTASAQQEKAGELFLKIILFVYFLPSLIGFFRIPIIRYKFITVLLINIFLGWTAIGWWISFIKAVSSRK